ncbi:hypothetical protein L6164_009809 [Bauhinia variegata]|uniref:Uncharacterized protein n=1 Tax=Bauhinia variegata TaxID=167791 RepID=A0ACB9PK95_BAUVA|nr:hypothetical protein L6164_009809 [Bauhinia variegata]
MAVLFFRRNIGLERDLPLLLLPTLLLKNLINGGGNFSVRPGLEMGLIDSFMLTLFTHPVLLSLLSALLNPYVVKRL